jgi:hypothetical protein
LNSLGWCWIATFAVCFVAMLVPKIWFLPYTFESWSRAWLIGSAVTATATAFLVSWIRRPSQLATAIELDSRFALRERCSSALALQDDDRESAIGRALVQDADHKLQRVDVRDAFPIRPAPQVAWTALPVAACLAMFWVPDAELPLNSLVNKGTTERILNIKNSTEPILKAVQKKRQDAEDAGDLEAAEEFKKIEDKLNTLQNANEADKKKVIADLNAMKQELQQKRDALGGADRMKKSMEGLKDLDKGPAEKMAKALQEGDFDQAEKELEKMLEGLKSDKLDAEQSKQLQKQLDQMQKAMEKAQENREQLRRDAKKELEKAEKEGATEKVAALRKQLEKLEEGDKQSSAMQKIQSQLAKAGEAMKQGDKKGAAEALEELQEQLEEMSEDQSNADELEEMMEQFEEAKNASKCEDCKGKGCQNCQKGGKDGKGNKGQKGQKGKGKGDKNKKPGDGMGEGNGEGDRDESESDFKDYDAQVRDEMRKGETVNGGKVSGKNRKGVTREEAREAVLTSAPDQPDAIENIQLPKAQRDQLKEYFDSLRGGK